MSAVVIYESLTGNTRRAAGIMGAELERAGVPTTVCPITRINYQALADADLVIVGTWTDGIFVVGQRPGRAARIRKLPVICMGLGGSLTGASRPKIAQARMATGESY